MAKPVNTLDDAVKGLLLVRDLVCPDTHTITLTMCGEGWQIKLISEQSPATSRMVRRMGLHEALDRAASDEHYAWTYWVGVVNRTPAEVACLTHLVRRVSGRR